MTTTINQDLLNMHKGYAEYMDKADAFNDEMRLRQTAEHRKKVNAAYKEAGCDKVGTIEYVSFQNGFNGFNLKECKGMHVPSFKKGVAARKEFGLKVIG